MPELLLQMKRPRMCCVQGKLHCLCLLVVPLVLPGCSSALTHMTTHLPLPLPPQITKMREEIPTVFLRALMSSNTVIHTAAQACLKTVLLSYKLPKNLLQLSVRPVLANLGAYRWVAQSPVQLILCLKAEMHKYACMGTLSTCMLVAWSQRTRS